MVTGAFNLIGIEDGIGYEEIYCLTSSYSIPNTPISTDVNGSVPSGWYSKPQSVSKIYPYQWVCKRSKVEGSWGSWSTPVEYNRYVEDGKNGELRYQYSSEQPLTPVGENPEGWSLSPIRDRMNYTHTGDFTMIGEWWRSPGGTEGNTTYKQRISFTTQTDNQILELYVVVSSEPTYDAAYVMQLDRDFSTDATNRLWTGSGETSTILKIAIPTAGSHYIELGYVKDSSISKGEDMFKYRFIEPINRWLTSGINGTWSKPSLFPTDTNIKENIYILTKRQINIELPSSDLYTAQYIGEAGSYEENKKYNVGNVVKYNSSYKLCIKNTVNFEQPDNNEYWEDCLWWTHEPSGTSDVYPYEYTAVRRYTTSWGNYAEYRIFSHWGKDGTKGALGAKLRMRTWTTGESYLAGKEGEEFYDVVVYKNSLYLCIKSHVSKQNVNDPVTSIENYLGYWESAQQWTFIATQLLIAGKIVSDKITADLIDADGITAKNADISGTITADRIYTPFSYKTLMPIIFDPKEYTNNIIVYGNDLNTNGNWIVLPDPQNVSAGCHLRFYSLRNSPNYYKDVYLSVGVGYGFRWNGENKYKWYKLPAETLTEVIAVNITGFKFWIVTNPIPENFLVEAPNIN